MKSFNLSQWALDHRSFVWFLMALAMVAGIMSYESLGREEDPSFTIKTMVVQVRWPGARVEETVQQITDRIEKEMKQIDAVDYTKSYTLPGQTTVFVYLKDATRGRAVSDAFYQVRKHVYDIQSQFPSGIQGPFFNDEFGDVFGNIYAFTGDGLSMRQLRDYVEQVRSELLSVPSIGKVTVIGAQDEAIYLDFSPRKLAGLGLDMQQVIDTLQAQNAITPSGVIQADKERVSVRVSGQFVSEDSLRAINLRVGDRFFRLADVAEISRGYMDPPETLFRYDGRPAIGLGIAMTASGNLLKFGEALKERMHDIQKELPIGVGVHLVSDQPTVVEEAVSGFTQCLVRSGGHRPRGEFRLARHAGRARRRLLDPAGSGDRLRRSRICGHIAAAHLARRLDHRARPAGRRCDDHRRDDGKPARGRRQPEAGGDLRLYVDSLSDADRHAGDGRELHPDRLEFEPGRRIHLYAVRRHGLPRCSSPGSWRSCSRR